MPAPIWARPWLRQLRQLPEDIIWFAVRLFYRIWFKTMRIEFGQNQAYWQRGDTARLANGRFLRYLGRRRWLLLE